MSTPNELLHIGVSNNNPDEQALDEILNLIAERGRKIRMLQKKSAQATAEIDVEVAELPPYIG